MEIIHELKFMKPSHVHVAQTFFPEDELVIRPNGQLMIFQKVETKTIAIRKKAIAHITESTPINAFRVEFSVTGRTETPIFNPGQGKAVYFVQ